MVSPLSPSSEVELKFQVSPDDVAAITANPIFAHKGAQTELRSVYYDTPNWDLRRGGVSLRVRLAEGVYIQTVKRQAGLSLFDRDEWESEIGGETPDRSAWDGTPVASILGKKGMHALGPVFTTEVRRTLRLVREGPSLVEVSLDQGELVAGELREPIEEVELELKGGDAVCLFGIARRLGADAVLRLSFESKAERGYRLIGHDGLTARRAQPVEIPSDMTALEGFTQVVRICMAQVAANAHLLRQVRNPEVLHQLRVGLRRLRAAFATFKPILPAEGLARLKKEVDWLGGELDPARDLDVFIENTLPAAKADARADPMLQAEFGERLLQAQASAYDRALAAVGSNRFAMFLLNCAEWAAIAPLGSDTAPVVASLRDGDASVLAAEGLDRLRRQLRKSGKHLAALDPVGRHTVRIKAKKLRYAAEFFAKTFGKSAPKRIHSFIASLNALQKALGDLNDMATARRTALAVVGRSTQLAFHAGLLVGCRDGQEPRVLAKAVHAYNRWRRIRPFWP
jgi:triphosphatase